MKYQLAAINRSWDSTLDKNLNLEWLDNLALVSRLWNIGHDVMVLVHVYVYSCWSRRDTCIFLYEISLIDLDILPWTKICSRSTDEQTYARPKHYIFRKKTLCPNTLRNMFNAFRNTYSEKEIWFYTIFMHSQAINFIEESYTKSFLQWETER